MPSNRIEDHVVRARQAVWVETADCQLLDLSRYPKMGMIVDEDRRLATLYAVVAYPTLGNDTLFEILFQSDSEDAAFSVYNALLHALTNAPLVH